MIKKKYSANTPKMKEALPVACFHNASISITVVEFFQTTASNPQHTLFEDIGFFSSSNLQVTIHRVSMSVLRADLWSTFVFPFVFSYGAWTNSYVPTFIPHNI